MAECEHCGGDICNRCGKSVYWTEADNYYCEYRICNVDDYLCGSCPPITDHSACAIRRKEIDDEAYARTEDSKKIVASSNYFYRCGFENAKSVVGIFTEFADGSGDFLQIGLEPSEIQKVSFEKGDEPKLLGDFSKLRNLEIVR